MNRLYSKSCVPKICKLAVGFCGETHYKLGSMREGSVEKFLLGFLGTEES